MATTTITNTTARQLGLPKDAAAITYDGAHGAPPPQAFARPPFLAPGANVLDDRYLAELDALDTAAGPGRVWLGWQTLGWVTR